MSRLGIVSDHDRRLPPPLRDKVATSGKLAQLLGDNVPKAGFIDRMKIRFRPYICPFHLLLPHIQDGLKYFDIGCGSGMFLRILAEYKNPRALGGTEVSERLIENAASLLQTCPVPLALHVYDGFDLPVEIERFDYLFLIDILHHLPRDQQFDFLERLFDRMKPGQFLLLKDIDAASPLVYWNKLHDLLLAGAAGHERKAEVVREHLRKIGFQIQLCFTKRVLLYPHYVLLCTKRSR